MVCFLQSLTNVISIFVNCNWDVLMFQLQMEVSHNMLTDLTWIVTVLLFQMSPNYLCSLPSMSSIMMAHHTKTWTVVDVSDIIQ